MKLTERRNARGDTGVDLEKMKKAGILRGATPAGTFPVCEKITSLRLWAGGWWEDRHICLIQVS